MKTTLICCFFATLFFCDAYGEGEREGEVSNLDLLKNILAEQQSLKTAQGILSYNIKYLSDPERETVSYAVRLSISAPDKYRIAIKSDDEIILYVSNGTFEWSVETIDGIAPMENEIDLSNNNGTFSFISSILPIRYKRLKDRFKIDMDEVTEKESKKHPRATAVMKLVPHSADDRGHIQWVHIYFDDKHRATSIEKLDRRNNLTAFVILKMDYNIKLSPGLFEYKVK